MNGKSSENRIKPLTAVVLAVCIICVILAGYYWIVRPVFLHRPGKNASAVVKVKVVAADGTVKYQEIYDDGGIITLKEPFESDTVEVYTHEMFGPNLSDDAAREVLMAASKQIDHQIIRTKIFIDGETCFALVDLNVNWSDPCCFYIYDAQSKTLKELYQWQNVDITDIALSGS